MDSVIELFKAANGLTPLAVIGLLVVVILLLVKHQKTNTAAMVTLKTNDLHQLPDVVLNTNEMVTALGRIESTLNDMSRQQSADSAYLHARLNGGGKS